MPNQEEYEANYEELIGFTPPRIRNRIRAGGPVLCSTAFAILVTLAIPTRSVMGAPADGSPSAEAIIAAKGCGACHTIPGIPGANGMVGPPLAGLRDREKIAGGVIDHTEANLRAWLKNPPAMKPGTAMFNLGLTDEEIDALIEFMYGL